ncbi:MAG: type II toxin-antitoxin system prevent-host-death family antitoxin, partial [Spirochaetia bacterium]|nr:type II toxin-antitoxin system prevent-host-death family antitoxin [Spirochaetia bacterium]
MTVPLFDVKAKLSEYVTLAEQGEVVEITKHGKTSAVIVSLKEYE